MYNPGTTYSVLRNLYISDDVQHLKKCKLRFDNYLLYPKTYRVVWFGANSDTPSNVNFKLDADGGILYISNEAGEILLSQIYPPAISRTSYARKVDGKDEWGYTSHPSPGASNRNSTFATERMPAPVVSTDSRLFTQPFDFTVDIPAGATLKYTTDGIAPGENNGTISTDGKFHVGATAIYRFCLLQDGKLPSQVVTRSFLCQVPDVSLPVVSVVTNKDYLYDDHIGIFVRGNNGKPGNGQGAACNWNMDWERPVNVEYFTTDGQVVVNQEADISVAGGWSRAHSPHSFKIKARKKFEGMNYIPYPIFQRKPHLKNKVWLLRNGGNDHKIRMKDAVMQEIILSSGIDVDGQQCQPVVHYLNGKFNGLLNVREPNNKDYAYANFGWDDTEIDQFQINGDSNYCQTCGTDEAFLKWYDLSSRAHLSSVYHDICQLVDIDEYVNYMAVEMFVGCIDYAQNNVKGFRPRTADGKFRIMLFDLDSSLGINEVLKRFESLRTHEFRFDSDGDGNRVEEVKFVTLFLNMLENAQFRKKFIDTYCLVAGSIFEPARCAAIIDSMAQQRVAALNLEGTSPLKLARELKSKLRGRPVTMIRQLKEYPRLKMENIKEFNLKLSTNLAQAKLTVNKIPVPTNRFNGTMFLPVTLKADAPAGYKFVGWESTNLNSQTLFDWGSMWKYYDQGSLDGQPWINGNLSQSWSNGQAPFGYNLKNANMHNAFKTHLDYGPDSSKKRITYYFHKDFQLNEVPQADEVYRLSFDVDDGAVVYVNGKEIMRYLMPEGKIEYGTVSTTYASVQPNRFDAVIPLRLLKKGVNTIAVEIHNCSATSSDIYFDGQLKRDKSSGQGTIVSKRQSYRIPGAVNRELKALFEPLSEEEQAALMPPVVINEISADNSIFINEYYRRNDWIELYNRSNVPVDIAGMYLSDDRTLPHKYKIVKNLSRYSTEIPPHGHFVLWADGLRPVSQLHTNFKLAREGGEVLLTAADDSWADTLIYETHDGKSSIGRYPDGSDCLYLMNRPTFGTANEFSTYARRFYEPDFPLGMENITAEEEPLVVKYRQRELSIVGATQSPVQLYLYNIGGQCVMQRQAEVTGGMTTFRLDGLPKGSYIARVSDVRGHQCHVKFVITTE